MKNKYYILIGILLLLLVISVFYDLFVIKEIFNYLKILADILYIMLPLTILLSLLFLTIAIFKQNKFVVISSQITYFLLSLGLINVYMSNLVNNIFNKNYKMLSVEILFTIFIIYLLTQSVFGKKKFFPVLPLVVLILYLILFYMSYYIV